MLEVAGGMTSLDKRYPEAMRPIGSVRGNPDYFSREGVEVSRCLAFPKLLSSYEEVVELVDNATPECRNRYRRKFGNFLRRLAERSEVFFRLNYKRFQLTERVFLLDSQSMERVVPRMVEEDCLDVFAPELNCILRGHDDFGLLVVSDAMRLDLLVSLESAVAESGLYLLRKVSN